MLRKSVLKKKEPEVPLLFDNRALFALIMPLIIEQMLTVLVGVAASIMVAGVGEEAVSAVSLVDTVIILLINLFAALATGGAVLAGQYLGMRRVEDARRAANQLISFMVVCSLVVMVLVYLGHSFILNGVFGQIEAAVMHHAVIYLLIVTASIPFIALYNAGAAIFRTMGNAKTPMMVSLLMNVINIGGNAVLVFGLHRGTEGVAIPTLVSRMIAGILIVLLLLNKKRSLHIQRDLLFRFDKGLVRRILSIGVPNGLENSMFQLGKILVLSLVSSFGTYAIAANAVSNAIALFQVLPGMAICLGVTTVVARCVGAGNYEQVKYYMKKLIAVAYMAMVVTNVIIFLALPLLMKLYRLSEQTSQVATKIMIFHGIMCMLIWPMSFMVPTVFRATGDALVCMIISIVSMWVFRIGFSYILGRYFGMGVFGIWISMVIDWAVRGICFLIRYRSGKWRHMAFS